MTLLKFDEMEKTGTASAKPAPVPEHKPVVLELEQPEIIVPRSEHVQLEVLQDNLGRCLDLIDSEVMKGCVTRLGDMPIIEREDFSELNGIYFFKISKLVYEEDESSADKLAMVFQTVTNEPCTVAMMLKSDGERTDIYLGARPNGDKNINSSATFRDRLKNSLLGFFPGSKIDDYYNEDLERDMDRLKKKTACVSEVTCVADYKKHDATQTNKEFIQGLEKFVYAMRGKSYTAIFIADNLSYEELNERKREYENIYTSISPFANMQLNFMFSEGKSSSMGISRSRTEGTSSSHSDNKTDTVTNSFTDTQGTSSSNTVTNSISSSHTDSQSKSKGITHTEGSFDSESKSVSKSMGVNLGKNNAGVSASKSKSKTSTHGTNVSDAVSRTLTRGLSNTKGKSHSIGNTESFNASRSTGMSTGRSVGQTETFGTNESFTLGDTVSLAQNLGTSQGVTLNQQNMSLSNTMEKLKKQLKRIDECESLGMWNFAAYFAADTVFEAETAANIYKSMVAGAESGIERSAVNSWHDAEDVISLTRYLSNFVHPQFLCDRLGNENERVAITPAALVSTKELAIHMSLPRHSIVGMPVAEHAALGKEAVSAEREGGRKFNIGNVYDMGEVNSTEIALDADSLTMHTFITGSTGSGKSTAVYNILWEATKKNIPFLAVEPAKGEYKKVFPDVACYGTNPLEGELLKIDPFAFPRGVHVLEHIDRIIEIFNVCWPMYAAMPAVLKDAVVNAYKNAGWNLELSVNEKIEGLYPTFDDVLREVHTTINSSGYSSDTKGDYIGSLCTRIQSLTNGINGLIFTSGEIESAKLFDQNAIVDISRVGSVETKSLIMGIVFIKLQEYRMAENEGMNQPLRHMTIIEEAHNLLKKTSTEQSADSSNLAGKSVEMLTNAIAEMRTYGEGFVIVDQAPNLLDTAVIRNTNTKIVLRLPEGSDREVTGKAMALKENQFNELSKLPTGVAAVYQNDWQEAVLCKLRYSGGTAAFARKSKPSKKENGKPNAVLRSIISDKIPPERLDEVRSEILKANLSAQARRDLILNLNRRNTAYEWAVADFINKNYSIRDDIFTGYNEGSDKSAKRLARIMTDNIRSEFDGFSEEELQRILYYICRIQHERHPECAPIEILRVDYLKKEILKWS